jgi:hypothetical protein
MNRWQQFCWRMQSLFHREIRKQLDFRYEQCISTLGTRQISDKSKDIISTALTPQLQGDLKRELQALGATHLPLNVNITGRDGGARHQITLASTAKRAKLSEILSEGEHCVVAKTEERRRALLKPKVAALG